LFSTLSSKHFLLRLILNIKERTDADVVVEQSAVENTWAFKEEATNEWRKLPNEKLHDLCSLPDIRVIKSRRMRGTGRGASTGETINA
jgi:hypothetical protein